MVELSNWVEMAKWSVVLITSGVVTALAIHYVTGTITARAEQAARAELHRLILTAQQQQAASTPPPTYRPPSGNNPQVSVL